MEPISIEDFMSRTGISSCFTQGATKVVPLRDLLHNSITSVQVMPRFYLDKLLRNVVLEGDETHKPYANCGIELTRIDSSNLFVGQTFVLKSKFEAFMDETNDVLATDYCIPHSITSRSALIVFGQSQNGEEVLAHYVPPIIEAVNGKLLLLDGIHRNYSALQAGATIESVVLTGVKTPQPFKVMSWSEIRVVDDKPPLELRYHDLKRERFRNLKWVGING